MIGVNSHYASDNFSLFKHAFNYMKLNDSFQVIRDGKEITITGLLIVQKTIQTPVQSFVWIQLLIIIALHMMKIHLHVIAQSP